MKKIIVSFEDHIFRLGCVPSMGSVDIIDYIRDYYWRNSP